MGIGRRYIRAILGVFGGLVLVAFIAWQAFSLCQLNQKYLALSQGAVEPLKAQVAALELVVEAFAEPQAVTAFAVQQNGQAGSIPSNAAPQAMSLAEAMGIMQGQYENSIEQLQGQYDRHANHMNFLFAALAAVISIFSLAMPLITYQVLNKDVVDKLDAEFGRVKDLHEAAKTMHGKMQEDFEKAETLHQQTQKTLQKADQSVVSVEAELDRMLKAIENIHRVIENTLQPNDGDRQMSVREFEPISESDADKARAAYQNAMREFRRKNYSKALALMNDAIRLEPENLLPHYSRGALLLKMKKYYEVLDAAFEAIMLEPDNAYFHASAALAHYSLKDYAQAKRSVEEALRLDEKNAIAHRVRGLCNLALWQNGDTTVSYEEILPHFDRAVDLDSDNAFNHIARAQYHIYKRNFTAAERDLRAAIKLDEADPEPYHWLAIMYEAMGEDAKAKECHAKADGLGYIPEPRE